MQKLGICFVWLSIEFVLLERAGTVDAFDLSDLTFTLAVILCCRTTKEACQRRPSPLCKIESCVRPSPSGEILGKLYGGGIAIQ